MTIDVGSPAIDRSFTSGAIKTYINKDNPANLAGILTSVEIWAAVDLTGCKVALFFKTNGDTLKCRSVHTIGNVTSGSKQTFAGLSLAIEVGDYIGIYYATGSLERDAFVHPGVWFNFGDHCVVDDETTYYTTSGSTYSLYGIGQEEAPPAGRSHAFIIG